QIRPFQPDDEDAVVSLWRQCDLVRPWNDPHKDIRRKLRVRADLFLVGVLDGKIVASVMAGYEGHRGWLNYLAVSPEHRRHGLGRAIVSEAERLLRESGCPKINLQIRTSNRDVIEFYRRAGYTVDAVVSLGKRLEQDGDGPKMGDAGPPAAATRSQARTASRKPDEPANGSFASPSTLWQFAIETAAQLRQTGLSEAGDILESAAKFVTGSGWEWLGELGIATKSIQKRFTLPDALRARISRIEQASTSKRPYGEQP
ncbi:MAG TPA: GNAT family acetyltransferase, partial [Candidatus Binatia bacterium]|nr:GNAT family acetyltransferase [Candidatus Binatia bacterium]